MFISICIPAYNSGDKLVRLLDSVKKQTFTDYEIVISDDSRNNRVKEIIDQQYSDLPISYYYNEQPLGTPGNWNNAVAKGGGEWIKLMHHDDWFLQDDALQIFAEQTDAGHSNKLIFCAFNYVDVLTGKTRLSDCSKLEIRLLKWNYLNLYKNFIGNPSCTLLSSRLKPYEYDRRIKWLIDFDFYCWFFQREKNFVYIDKPLIAFAVHPSQVTASVQQNPVVEIPETFLLLDKYGASILKNLFVYDFFWRMYRNLDLKDITEFETYLGAPIKYPAIINMLKMQGRVSLAVLKKGYFSKLLMFIAYLKNRLG